MTETPTPTADAGAERESGAEFVAKIDKDYRPGQACSFCIDHDSMRKLIALARRATTPAPQREGGYQAGLMRAAEIAATHPQTSHDPWVVQQDISIAIRAEAAAPNLTAPRIVEKNWKVGIGDREFGEVEWRITDTQNTLIAVFFSEENARSCVDARPLYAAPPAPVPAGEVTELLKRYRLALVRGNAFGSHQNDDEIAAVDAALTAARPRADAGVTEAEVDAALGASHGLVGAATVRNMLRAALAAREVR